MGFHRYIDGASSLVLQNLLGDDDGKHLTYGISDCFRARISLARIASALPTTLQYAQPCPETAAHAQTFERRGPSQPE